MDADSKLALDRRLARMEGQVRGLRRMLNEDQYCIDILTQVAAVRAALEQLSAEIASAHMKSCILGHGSGSEHEEAKKQTPHQLVEELRKTMSRMVR